MKMLDRQQTISPLNPAAAQQVPLLFLEKVADAHIPAFSPRGRCCFDRHAVDKYVK
jgi:hypothetical protein